MHRIHLYCTLNSIHLDLSKTNIYRFTPKQMTKRTTMGQCWQK